ncbi:MAG: PAS domain-containing protein, partial [Pseudomonadota bacterium]
MDIDQVVSSLHEIVGDAIVVQRVEGTSSEPNICWVSPSFCELSGYPSDDLIGKPFSHLGDADPYTLEELNDAFLMAKACELELEATRQDGARFWCELRLRPVFDSDGALTAWVSTHRDISERKAREEHDGMALSERVFFEEQLMLAKANSEAAQRRLMDAIQAIPDAFVIYDEQDRLVVCNDQYKKAYVEIAHVIEPGVQFEEVLRAGLAVGQYKDALGREEEWLAERLESHNNPTEPEEQELTGERFLRVHEKRTESGDTVGCRVDISALKRSQRELEQNAIALEKA